MSNNFSIISPNDGQTIATREYANATIVNETIGRAKLNIRDWHSLEFEERLKILKLFIKIFESKKDIIAASITEQMGRPIRFTPGEVAGVVDRANKMLSIGATALKKLQHENDGNIERYIEREPLGTLLIVAPWNYPFLTVINSLIPALLAGNSVIIKHSPYTALCAETLVECLLKAGLPSGICQFLHLTNEDNEKLLRNEGIDGVIFTGSVNVGRRVEAATAGRFIPVGLELGGKDAAYIRPDADISFTAENIVEGALFNSGQSCCGIERIYAHADIYDDLIDQILKSSEAFKLGLPTLHETMLGPVINKHAAEKIQCQIDDAINCGASALLSKQNIDHLPDTGTYVSPQFLTNVNHEMTFMKEETFGPNAGIMKVHSDEEAIRLINDSEFGLTASIWSADKGAVKNIGRRIDAGTIFMNRCDYLDPSLTWSGFKNSGRGYSLGEYGYLQVTRPKSFHLRSI
ncbi:MAG: aldehyde dehydrogenase family protein [Emcibacteraceae bacterium]|nr:aldehyde dehydrogenase family protein [Emcibacteraceae bacterium]